MERSPRKRSKPDRSSPLPPRRREETVDEYALRLEKIASERQLNVKPVLGSVAYGALIAIECEKRGRFRCKSGHPSPHLLRLMDGEAGLSDPNYFHIKSRRIMQIIERLQELVANEPGEERDVVMSAVRKFMLEPSLCGERNRLYEPVQAKQKALGKWLATQIYGKKKMHREEAERLVRPGKRLLPPETSDDVLPATQAATFASVARYLDLIANQSSLSR